MKPGPELDKLVHKHVMELPWSTVPPYSTDMTWAWHVVEKCFDGGEVIGITRDLDGQYIVGISNWTGSVDGARIWDDTKYEPQFKCPTAPHAICIAAVSFYLPDQGESLEYVDPGLQQIRDMFSEEKDDE